jgi:hypothetical protein
MTFMLAVYLLLVTLLLAWMLIDLWPANPQSVLVPLPASTPAAQTTVPSPTITKTNDTTSPPVSAATPTPTATAQPEDVRFFRGSLVVGLTLETRLILIVLVSGALGSLVHALGSFVDYVGNRKLATSWIAWYVTSPFIGSLLALILYLVLRGGLMTPSASTGSLNFYGTAALSALTGMFSRQARDKLKELFDVLFRVAQKETRSEPLVADASKPPPSSPPEEHQAG